MCVFICRSVSSVFVVLCIVTAVSGPSLCVCVFFFFSVFFGPTDRTTELLLQHKRGIDLIQLCREMGRPAFKSAFRTIGEFGRTVQRVTSSSADSLRHRVQI